MTKSRLRCQNDWWCQFTNMTIIQVRRQLRTTWMSCQFQSMCFTKWVSNQVFLIHGPCIHANFSRTFYLRKAEKFLPSIKWTASSEFGTYCLCEQRRFRRACASAQSRQNLRCSLIQPVSQEEPSDRKPVPWPLWMAGHAQLKFVMTECSKTQIRLTGLKWFLIRDCVQYSTAILTMMVCLCCLCWGFAAQSAAKVLSSRWVTHLHGSWAGLDLLCS